MFSHLIAETPDGSIWLTDKDRIWKISVEKDLLAKAAKQGNANIELPCKAINLSKVRDWTSGPLQVSHLLFTRNQKLLVGTNHGLFRLVPATEQVFHELPMPDFNIHWMAESNSGELLLTGQRTNNQTVWVRMVGGKVQYLEEDHSGHYGRSNFVYDDAGCFWKFHNRSIQRWKPSAFFGNGKPELEIPQLGNKQGYGFTYIMKDKSDLIWVGTSGYGIVKINPKGQKIKNVLPGTAHRMESSGEAGKVNISESTYMLVKEQFKCEFRGMISAKGKGEVGMYYVTGEEGGMAV